MRLVCLLLSTALAVLTTASTVDAAISAAPDKFEGVWTGEVVGPDAHTPFGLAFTKTDKALLVSVYMPEMFLYGVNFGPAEIQGATFQLPPLNLRITRDGDRMTGTFALAGLPVILRRGGMFGDEPAVAELPPAPGTVWTRELGAPVWATPSTRDGVVYVGTTDGKFHAVGADHGDEVWTWAGSSPLYGEALTMEDNVFFVDENSVLICLQRRDGALKWRLPLYDETAGKGPAPKNETFNHRAVTPVIDTKGVLYVGSADGGIYAVKASSGKRLWRHEAKAKIYAPVTLDGDELVVGCFDGTVLRLQRSTHRELQRSKPGGPIVSAPVVAADHIVVGCRDYMVYGLNRTTGAVDWRKSYWFSWVESTPRLEGGILYIGGSDFRRVSAIDPASGRTFWSTDVRGLSWGSPLISSDLVFAGTVGQNIAGTVIKHSGGIVAMDRKTGAVRWRYAAAGMENAEFTGFAGSLIRAGDKLVGGDVSGRLIALPIGGSAESRNISSP